MLDIDAINAELRDLSKSKGHTFEYDQNSGRYSISYWNPSMDRVSETVDFQTVQLLSQDELVTYLLQIVFKTREKQKMGGEEQLQIVCPIALFSLFWAIIFVFPGLYTFPLAILAAPLLMIILYYLIRRSQMNAVYKADMMTYTVRPGFVDVLNKLASESTNQKMASMYHKRADRLTGRIY